LTAYNNSTGANTLSVEGTSISNAPVVGPLTSLAVNNLVLVLRVRTNYFILGKITVA
jgi:hypothetical protein